MIDFVYTPDGVKYYTKESKKQYKTAHAIHHSLLNKKVDLVTELNHSTGYVRYAYWDRSTDKLIMILTIDRDGTIYDCTGS